MDSLFELENFNMSINYVERKIFLEDKIFESVIKRYLHKDIFYAESKDIDYSSDDFWYGGLVEWNEDSFRIALPTGLTLLYKSQNPETVFTALDKKFIEACMEVFNPTLYLMEVSTVSEFDGVQLIQFINGLDKLWQPDDELIAKYISTVTSNEEITYKKKNKTIGNRLFIINYLRLIREIMNAKIEGQPIVSGLALFPNLKSIKQACDSLTLFDEVKELSNFKDMKPFLPIADGDKSFILVAQNRIYGIGRISDLYSVNNGQLIYRNDIAGKPLLTQFKGHGSCEIKGLFNDKLMTLMSFVNGVPVIRDEQNVIESLRNKLLRFFPSLSSNRVSRFANLLLRLPKFGHGATVIVGENFPNLVRAINLKTNCLESKIFNEDNKDLDLQGFLLRHAFPDGAILFDQKLKLKGIGCILPIHATPTSSSVGARHTSALSYSQSYDHIVVIVISQDGPLSVFKGGQLVLSV